MGKDKRLSERKPMYRVCRYRIDHRDYADLSTNISDKGIFIKNFSPPPIGTQVQISAVLSEQWGNLPIVFNGRVAWIDSGSDPHQHGMGIEFESIRVDSLPIIRYFVGEVYRQPASGEARFEIDPKLTNGKKIS